MWNTIWCRKERNMHDAIEQQISRIILSFKDIENIFLSRSFIAKDVCHE